MTWTADVASSLGAPESGLKLILGQLSGYPIFLLYRAHLGKLPAWLQHLYFALTGLFMAYWAIGPEAVTHSSICICVTFCALKAMDNSWYVTPSVLFAFNLTYLFVGYVFNATREYDITWTMPQCVLCLRLIGLAIDVHDGTKPDEQLSKDQKTHALKAVPNLLEMFSHAFFIGGYFVGPQFSMRKFQRFMERNSRGEIRTSPVTYGLGRLGLGVAYMLTHLIASGYFPENYVMTKEFEELNFLTRSLYFWFWVKAILTKYIAAWLFAEGACVIAGLGYNGGTDDSPGDIKWDGVANVRTVRLETCSKFQHIIESFNINTNQWVASYVYKRLRFLNNKNYSQIGVLVFLAVWHGYHSGYYITFFNEFWVMLVEKKFVEIFEKSPLLNPIYKSPAGSVLGWLYTSLMLPHCFLCFALLKADKYWPVLKATNFFLYFYIGGGLALAMALKQVLVPKSKPKHDKAE